MKNIIFFTVVFFFFSFSLFSQVNVGFTKATNLEEAVSCSTQEEALSRFISALENKNLAPFFSARISQSWDNAGKVLKGEKITLEGMIQILKYVKKYPESAKKDYGVLIYKLPKGTYTFETLTLRNGSWISGKEISRSAREGEWVLEWYDQKIASSWCLNLFGSVGEVQAPKEKIIKETVRIVRDTVYDYIDRTPPPTEYRRAPAPAVVAVVQQEPCSCWREAMPKQFSTTVTYTGYVLFPAGAVVIQDPFRGPLYEDKPLYMCKGRRAPRSSYTFHSDPTVTEAFRDTAGNLYFR